MRILSQLATVARGSAGGITASANQFHQIILRGRTAPVNPNTLMQTKIRSAFTTANALWHAMSPVNQQGWIDYADSLTFSGPLGNYKVPGRQVFLSNVGWAFYLSDRGAEGATVLLGPPTELGFLAIQNLNVKKLTAPGTGYAVSGDNPNPEGITVVVMNSRAFDYSRMRYKGPFKSATIYSEDVATTAAFDIPIANLQDGKRYFCSVRAISNTDANRLSAKFFLNFVATVTE